MAITIKINTNIDELPVFLNSVNEKAVRQAVGRSITRTMTGINTETKKIIKDKELLDLRRMSYSKLLQRKIISREQKTNVRQPIADMYGAINFTAAHLSLAYFFPKLSYVTKPVAGPFKQVRLQSISVKPAGKRVTLSRGWMMIKKLGVNKSPIFERTGTAPKAIKKMFGPRVSKIIERSGAADQIQTYAQGRYEREFATNLDYYLGRI